MNTIEYIAICRYKNIADYLFVGIDVQRDDRYLCGEK